MDEPVIIAIDGPVASGKTVVGRMVAQKLGFRFLDTGAMYRAATRLALDRGVDLEEEEGLARLARGLKMELAAVEGGDRLLVDGQDLADRLRDPDVERGVSLVAKVSAVRRALVEQQRAIASEGPTVVVGRDIGTVVMPNAPIKVYLTAPVDVRARRRYEELQRRGEAVDYAQTVMELQRRDKIDSERADSPLRPAEDATVIDTEGRGVEELAHQILGLVGNN